MSDQLERDSVLEAMPEIADGRGKRLLYIGASKYRAFMLPDFIGWGYEVDVLEIWPTNALHIRDAYGVNTVQGDVVWLDLYFKGPYDIVFWWHGPEHVGEREFLKVLGILRRMSKAVVLGCPAGESPQDAVYDNPFERHLRAIQQSDLEALGFSTRLLRRPDLSDHLTAWLRNDGTYQ